jgi:lipopolysaccharide transport system permease protein
MVWRDLKGRYQQMALGPLWIVIQPLMSMVLYTLIFGVIAKLPSENQPYAVFTYVALLPWGFFTDAVGAGSSSLVDSKTLISKIYFPRLILPLSRVLSSLVDLAISFLILIGMLIYYGIHPNWGILLIPVFLAIAAMTGLGVGLWFAGIIVRYRDFGQIAGYMVRIWMYATPVVYSITLVPARWLGVLRLNPMTGVVEGFRWALLGTSQPPDWRLLLSTLLMVPVLIGGLYVFKRSERNIVDIA